MIDATQRRLLLFCVTASAAWWSWIFLSWRRERRLSRRLEKITGAEIKNHGPFGARLERLQERFVRRVQAKKWRRDLPDFFELLALAQSAGMSLPHAWMFASKTMDRTTLSALLGRVESLLRVGQSWDQALSAFAGDVDDERCEWIVGLMRQNLRRGSPLAGMLIDQVEQWHYAEAMAAERRAQTLSLKLLFPIFMFLLPAVFVVLFAPLLLRFSKGIPLF